MMMMVEELSQRKIGMPSLVLDGKIWLEKVIHWKFQKSGKICARLLVADKIQDIFTKAKLKIVCSQFSKLIKIIKTLLSQFLRCHSSSRLDFSSKKWKIRSNGKLLERVSKMTKPKNIYSCVRKPLRVLILLSKTLNHRIYQKSLRN